MILSASVAGPEFLGNLIRSATHVNRLVFSLKWFVQHNVVILINKTLYCTLHYHTHTERVMPLHHVRLDSNWTFFHHLLEGYDGLFFGRLDHEDEAQRITTKTMEMVWSASTSLTGSSSDLFTGVNYKRYQAPPGFCFDILCSTEPIIDDPNSKEYNVDQRVIRKKT